MHPLTLQGLKSGKKVHIALHRKHISELQSVTCHMGSHCVTCHPTQVNAMHPTLTPARQAGAERDGRLS